MARKRTIKPQLPRLTVLAMSRKDLERFSNAAELVSAAAYQLADVVDQLVHQVSVLEALAGRMPGRGRRRPAPVNDDAPDEPPFIPGREGDHT